MARPPRYSREEIVMAAERVVTRLGAPNLSFDAVAREAGVSKGAVLHYFGTKEPLIGAMVARLSASMETEPGPLGRAGIARLIAGTTATPGNEDGVATALLAAVAQDLALLAPSRAANRTHLDRLAASARLRGSSCTSPLTVSGCPSCWGSAR